MPLSNVQFSNSHSSGMMDDSGRAGDVLLGRSRGAGRAQWYNGAEGVTGQRDGGDGAKGGIWRLHREQRHVGGYGYRAYVSAWRCCRRMRRMVRDEGVGKSF